MISALAGNGNSVIVVEHERELIRSADWVIELGPGAGAQGGHVIAAGTPGQLESDPRSIIGPFLAGAPGVSRDRSERAADDGQIAIEIADLYNLHDLTAEFPVNRLTAGRLGGLPEPSHVRRLNLQGIRQVVQIDASPIGQNARSTLACPAPKARCSSATTCPPPP
jgi:excinuclease ABC subunit A